MSDMQAFLLQIIDNYKYLGLYMCLVFGIIGLPLPIETLMTFAGFKIFQGQISFGYAVIFSWLGALSGMSISYVIGQKVGQPLLHKFGKYLHITPERLHKANSWLEKYRGKAIMVGYFIPGFRHLTPYAAGYSEMSYLSFLFYAALGALVWVLCFVGVGTLVGKDWIKISALIQSYLGLIIFVAVIIGVAYWFVRKQRTKKS